MAIPRKDSSLMSWSANANTRLTAGPETYGTTPAVAAQYDALHLAFAESLHEVTAARESGTRSSSLCAIKDRAKLALLNFARPLYKTIQANAAVTDAAKIELGVLVLDGQRTPIPAPNFAPQLTIVSVDGRLVKVRLSDPANPTHSRIPDRVSGATVMSFVGEAAPTDPTAFKYAGSTSKSTAEILFPESVAPGTQVWLTAFFFNDRKQNGPACIAVGTIINYGGTMPMAA